MAGSDNCWQGRSPLDRLRNLSITCLVLDAIFALLYGVSALKDSTSAELLQCYKDYGYYWHNVVELAFAVSSVAAVCGIAIHASISCAASFQDRQLVNVNYFGHALVCWTFLQALAEAIAYRQEPQDCIDRYGSQSSTTTDSTEESGTNLVWQVAYTMLWLAWVTGAVATAVLARRILPILHHLQATSTPGTPGWSPSNDSNSNEAGAMPQTVGMPVQFPPGNSVQLSTEANQGACGPSPTAASQGAALPASPSAGWQGGSTMVVAGGGLVAQGRPVDGSSPPDPEKAAAQAAASVAKTGSE